jgi:CheY-like chemotaxis protein
MRTQQILVLEDSDEDFETVRDAARRGGMPHRIVRARSGAECLSVLRASLGSRDTKTLLLLLDLNTHGDDGRDVLSEVGSDDLLGTLPVVVLSASANSLDIEFCYANGANAYHIKPVDHGLHLKVLQDIFTYWLGSVVLPARSSRA